MVRTPRLGKAGIRWFPTGRKDKRAGIEWRDLGELAETELDGA